MNHLPLEILSLSKAVAKGEPHPACSRLVLTPAGVEGDRHGGKPLRQFSLLDAAMTTPGDAPGSHKENAVLRGLAAAAPRLLDRIEFGEAALEITTVPQVDAAAACKVAGAGYYARIAAPGTLHTGQHGLLRRRTLAARIITLSDRAHAGEYADRSGPAAAAALEAWCAAAAWRLDCRTQLLPDDPDALAAALRHAAAEGAHLVLTTGGTGLGPRDRTPEAVLHVAERTIPGIMEHLRARFGPANPRALLSRGVAATLGNTFLCTLPGSPNGVREYIAALAPLLEHLLLTLRGLDPH